MDRLPLLAQTAYARLLDLLIAAEAGGDLAGTSLVSKVIAGHRYWYAQRTENEKKVQHYLGRETPQLQALIARWRRAREEAATRAELIAMARAAGGHVVSAAEAKVIDLLQGVFRVGGVLVGSHAFGCYGNMLGIRWGEALVRTEDVDVAHDYRIAVALARDVEPIKLSDALDAIPRHSLLDPTSPATTFQVRGTDIEVDLLTPLVGRDTGKPIQIPALGAAAMPLRFMDYLIEETEPAATLGGHGTLVNVPRPGRFALHKLLVAGRRGRQRGGIAKASKDRIQAAALLEVLLADLPGEITLAWKALGSYRGWTKLLRESFARLDDGLVERLRALGVGR